MKGVEELKSFPLAFGGGGISGSGGGYGFGDITESASIELLKQAYKFGVRVFDTAPIYGFGLSEERIGRAFSQNRSDVFITSKSGVSWGSDQRVDMNNSAQCTERMLLESLDRLKTDYLDLYMVHWPSSAVDISEPLTVLKRYQEKGAIRFIGLCNTNIEDVTKAQEVVHIDCLQSELNIFRPNLRPGLENYIIENKTAFQSWGTLDKGILTGRVSKKRECSKDYDVSDSRKKAPWWNHKEVLKKLEFLEPVWPLLKEYNVTPLRWAISHNLNKPFVSQVLVGARSIEQLTQVVEAVQNPIKQKIIDEVNQLIEGYFA